jgi:hypothetical protein
MSETREEAKVEHTPGPWRSDDRGPLTQWNEWGIEIVAGSGREIATVWLPNEDRSEADATARLIAAAPDLLEALRRLRGEVRGSVGLYGVEDALREVAGNSKVVALLNAVEMADEAIAKALPATPES